MINNGQILEELLKRIDDLPDEEQELFDDDDETQSSVNGEQFRKYMKDWDMSEPFPYADTKKYIRMNEWKKKDFSYENESIIVDKLPSFVHDVYFKVKEFRSNSRNELLSTEEMWARMMGYPYKTQDEKAFCLYQYAFQYHYERSDLHPDTNKGE
jgi:hypothetical protein